MPVLEIKNCTKIYKKGFRALRVPAVVDLSFTIDERKIVGFVGPNGAGKTTTIKMIMGLVGPTAGSIKLNGLDATEVRSRKGIAYLSEQPYFYRHLTVKETLHFSGRLLGLKGADLASCIGKVTSKVDLTGRERMRVRDLSKGLQQRLNMACALLGDPHTLILDEPMSGMDPPGRRLFRSILTDLASEGRTVFFSTHILDDIESVCDEVVVLSKGKLSYAGKVADLLEKGFLGIELTLDALSDLQAAELRAKGYTVEQDGVLLRIFVPREQDPRECQRWLSERNLWCSSIQRRVMPLETLLYGGGRSS